MGVFLIVTISEGELLTFSRQELETPWGSAKEEKVSEQFEKSR